MRWNKYTLTTTAEAEDMISSMMMPTGKAAMMDTVSDVCGHSSGRSGR